MLILLINKISPEVTIEGYTYCDSPLSATAETHLEKVVELGAQKVLLVNHNSPGSSRRIEHRLFDLWISLQGKKSRKGYNQAQHRTRDYQLPKEIKFLLLEHKNLF